VPDSKQEELEGLTLSVYLYVVKKGKPVGPRDVVKGAHLSSPSVAYRHLQKLEDMGFLAKDAYGEYVLKDKARVRGYVWVGRRMIPKMLVYSLIFLGVLIAELVVLALHYSVKHYSFKIFFLLLALVTGAAMAVFIAEGLLQRRRLRQSILPE
jgi:hypothetical protein